MVNIKFIILFSHKNVGGLGIITADPSNETAPLPKTDDDSQISSIVPDVLIYKYNRFVDGIFGRINKILKRSYDPVSVRLSPSGSSKHNSKSSSKKHGQKASSKKNKR